MRKTLLTALMMVLLMGGMLGKRCHATTLVGPLNAVVGDASFSQTVSEVCGPYRCVRTYRPYYVPYYGFYRPWGWSDVGRPSYYVPYYGYYRPWGWSDVNRWY
jgi:hypothetical protein